MPDDSGLKGLDIKVTTVELFVYNPKLVMSTDNLSTDNILQGTVWSTKKTPNYIGEDDKMIVSQGISYEGPVGLIPILDLKVKRSDLVDFKNKTWVPYEQQIGIGAPWVEVKYTHNSVHNSHEIRQGMQEDITVFRTPGPLNIAAKLSVNFQWFIKFTKVP